MSEKTSPANLPQFYTNPSWIFSSILLLCFAQPVLGQQDPGQDLSASLQEARAMCDSLTEQNKALASAAGYDIGKLCQSLDFFNLDDHRDVIRLNHWFCPETWIQTVTQILRVKIGWSKSEPGRRSL